jgi:starch synthase (maltosyl-transferring)
MRMYNLFPRLVGPVSQWEPHLARAADLGFDSVFINPVQKPGYSGSLYSVADYQALNPLLADPADQASPEDQLRKVLHHAREKHGLTPVVDLVINHCAFDSTLVKTNPEWFFWENGQVVHPSCDENGHRVVWEDLARFNHRPAKNEEGLQALFYRAANYLLNLGFTGFRCDAAYQVPRATWEKLFARLRRDHPGVIFMAETLGCTPDQTRETAGAGFDYVFNSSKWWDFSGPWMMEQYNLIRDSTPSISFPESHDTPRLAAETNGNVDALKQRYLFAGLFSTGVLMPVGYEFGFRKPLHVVNTVPADWEENTGIDLSDFIRKVNALKSGHEVFRGDHPTNLLHTDNPNVLLMWKGSTKTREEALVILNKDCWNWQHFEAGSLRHLVQSGAALECVSPDNPMPFVAEPFRYDLRPGEAIVLTTKR